MRARALAIVLVVAFLVSGVAFSGAAEKGDKQLRFGLLYSMPTDDYVDGFDVTELDASLGFQAAFEFRVTDRIGIEPGLQSVSYDLSIEDVNGLLPDIEGDTDMLGLTANVNFHFERDSGLDLWVGPTVGYAFWDDIGGSGFVVPVPTDDEFIFGANFGLDVPIGEGAWGFNAGFSYLFFDIADSDGDSIGVSPMQLRAGATYSF